VQPEESAKTPESVLAQLLSVQSEVTGFSTSTYLDTCSPDCFLPLSFARECRLEARVDSMHVQALQVAEAIEHTERFKMLPSAFEGPDLR
jgi:hypothetical protein